MACDDNRRQGSVQALPVTEQPLLRVDGLKPVNDGRVFIAAPIMAEVGHNTQTTTGFDEVEQTVQGRDGAFCLGDERVIGAG